MPLLQALLKLADAEAGDRRKACAAEALRRAREARQCAKCQRYLPQVVARY